MKCRQIIGRTFIRLIKELKNVGFNEEVIYTKKYIFRDKSQLKFITEVKKTV